MEFLKMCISNMTQDNRLIHFYALANKLSHWYGKSIIPEIDALIMRI